MTRRTFFTSDTHFGHGSIIGYCARPFANAAEMDEALVERWNETVRPDDLVYHLGDFAVSPSHAKRIRPRLNGTVRLVAGNHDDVMKLAAARLFQRIYGAFRVFREEGFVASHVPIARHHTRAPVNVHGHVHNNPDALALIEPHQVNISVEVTGYRPLSLDELLQRIIPARGVSHV